MGGERGLVQVGDRSSSMQQQQQLFVVDTSVVVKCDSWQASAGSSSSKQQLAQKEKTEQLRQTDRRGFNWARLALACIQSVFHLPTDLSPSYFLGSLSSIPLCLRFPALFSRTPLSTDIFNVPGKKRSVVSDQEGKKSASLSLYSYATLSFLQIRASFSKMVRYSEQQLVNSWLITPLLLLPTGSSAKQWKFSFLLLLSAVSFFSFFSFDASFFSLFPNSRISFQTKPSGEPKKVRKTDSKAKERGEAEEEKFFSPPYFARSLGCSCKIGFILLLLLLHSFKTIPSSTSQLTL